ncbi:HlyD family type I secretion periplasmic adaptor subunit [Cupriavidus sp. 2SB]|uniref:HlyD family type I secretion periplasmic adaptor subunit n=1 Tax=Cupriavidus sp. 2SB TaxID=2502199 RepID=UPI0010F7A8EE|nr:HlyD family type I secretion periplasmic adaptor subunit [Cupriavidus sp. 2SB]
MTISQQLCGLGDLLAHYGKIFSLAWRDRKVLDGPAYRRDEAAFLPAALALTASPPSPIPRVTLWLLISFLVIALTWAIFGQIDIVATAQGKIVPNDRTKVIQPVEVATITGIHVTDGQFVRAGETLIELDPTASKADQARLSHDLALARLQVARAQAILDTIERGHTPQLVHIESVSESAFRQAQGWLDGQYRDYQAKVARIEADMAKREAEAQSTREMVRKLERTLPLAQQRAQDFKDLADRNFVSKHGYLEKEQIRIEQEADLATQRSRLKEQEAALREGKAGMNALVAETRRTNLELLNEGKQKEAELTQEVTKASVRVKQQSLIAPVDGKVQQLAVHTVGGVVTEAQALMVVVPSENAVEIEAMLENKDIGFVKPGQSAIVKVETFLYTKYGTIDGTVTTVSDDAIQDEKRGLIYAARIRLKQNTIDVDGKQVAISPGMLVTAEIKTGKRRLIEYFLSPLIQHTSESLRER